MKKKVAILDLPIVQEEVIEQVIEVIPTVEAELAAPPVWLIPVSALRESIYTATLFEDVVEEVIPVGPVYPTGVYWNDTTELYTDEVDIELFALISILNAYIGTPLRMCTTYEGILRKASAAGYETVTENIDYGTVFTELLNQFPGHEPSDLLINPNVITFFEKKCIAQEVKSSFLNTVALTADPGCNVTTPIIKETADWFVELYREVTQDPKFWVFSTIGSTTGFDFHADMLLNDNRFTNALLFTGSDARTKPDVNLLRVYSDTSPNVLANVYCLGEKAIAVRYLINYPKDTKSINIEPGKPLALDIQGAIVTSCDWSAFRSEPKYFLGILYSMLPMFIEDRNKLQIMQSEIEAKIVLLNIDKYNQKQIEASRVQIERCNQDIRSINNTALSQLLEVSSRLETAEKYTTRGITLQEEFELLSQPNANSRLMNVFSINLGYDLYNGIAVHMQTRPYILYIKNSKDYRLIPAYDVIIPLPSGNTLKTAVLAGLRADLGVVYIAPTVNFKMQKYCERKGHQYAPHPHSSYMDTRGAAETVTQALGKLTKNPAFLPRNLCYGQNMMTKLARFVGQNDYYNYIDTILRWLREAVDETENWGSRVKNNYPTVPKIATLLLSGNDDVVTVWKRDEVWDNCTFLPNDIGFTLTYPDCEVDGVIKYETYECR